MSLLSISYAPTGKASQCVFGIFFSFYQHKFLGSLAELPLNAEKSALQKQKAPYVFPAASALSGMAEKRGTSDEAPGVDRIAEADKKLKISILNEVLCAF
ncbi:hypothetical protein [uncultured Mailhella sp.]|uniref:hypothetical protein n=1 Tax=uncultured Mailhella sp. TaxID=1981031 RepID=UPI0025F738CC|nr:hypothetical protein [uncultured Mailhella sp.]